MPRILVMPMLFAGLSACAASIPPVQVTRFHLNQAIPAGSVAPVPAGAAISPSLEQTTYETAVAREFARLGFAPPTPGTPPRYRFRVDVERAARPAAQDGSTRVSVGGGSFGGGFGGGLGVSFGLGGNNDEVVQTKLSVRLIEGETTRWEGRAETSGTARSPAAQPGLAADKLARALFQDFPGESGRTVTVP